MELEKEGHGNRERIKRELSKEEVVINYINCYEEVREIHFTKIVKLTLEIKF